MSLQDIALLLITNNKAIFYVDNNHNIDKNKWGMKACIYKCNICINALQNEYIILVKNHCNQYKDLLKTQLIVRRSLAFKHQNERTVLYASDYKISEVAALLYRQSSELTENYLTSQELKIKLKRLHAFEKHDMKLLIETLVLKSQIL